MRVVIWFVLPSRYRFAASWPARCWARSAVSLACCAWAWRLVAAWVADANSASAASAFDEAVEGGL